MKKLFFNFNRLLLLGLAVMTMSSVWGVTTYQHIFSTSPGTGDNKSLSGVKWNITASNLGSYNSGYKGVQFGTSKKTGNIVLTSAAAWSYDTNKTKITEVRLWLNSGAAGKVTASVTIGGTAATSDGTTVGKNSSASAWNNGTYKITFTPSSTANTGVIVITATTGSNNAAGYICGVEIDCEAASSCTDPEITTQPQGATYTKDATPTALSITATGADAYQWYSNTSSSTSGASAISGATSSTYTPSTATVGTKYYYCVASKSTCTTTSSIVAVVVNAPSYTVTASSNNTELGTVSISNNVITASPKSCVGYASTAYTVTSGTATVSQNGNVFTVTPTANCNVQINFAALSSDTYVDNVHSTSMTGNYCGSYTAPKIDDKTVVAPAAQTGECAHDHYHFVGWSSSKISTGQPTEPAGLVKEGAAMTANGTTYYAVWAKEAQ